MFNKNNKSCTKAKRAVLPVGLFYDQSPDAVCAVIATLRPQQRDTKGTKRRQKTGHKYNKYEEVVKTQTKKIQDRRRQ